MRAELRVRADEDAQTDRIEKVYLSQIDDDDGVRRDGEDAEELTQEFGLCVINGTGHPNDDLGSGRCEDSLHGVSVRLLAVIVRRSCHRTVTEESRRSNAPTGPDRLRMGGRAGSTRCRAPPSSMTWGGARLAMDGLLQAAGVRYETHLSEREPIDAILDAAASHRADIIVRGGRNHGEPFSARCAVEGARATRAPSPESAPPDDLRSAGRARRDRREQWRLARACSSPRAVT